MRERKWKVTPRTSVTGAVSAGPAAIGHDGPNEGADRAGDVSSGVEAGSIERPADVLGDAHVRPLTVGLAEAAATCGSPSDPPQPQRTALDVAATT